MTEDTIRINLKAITFKMQNNNPRTVTPKRIGWCLAEINKLHADNLGAARTTFIKAIRIGELLSEIKNEMAHGEWLAWLKANVQFSQQTASKYMRLFDERDRLKLLSFSNLTDAYSVLAEPELPPIPSWAKEAYPMDEAMKVFEICAMTAFIKAKQGIIVPVEELMEVYFTLLENRIRTNAAGGFEHFDGEKWNLVMPPA